MSEITLALEHPSLGCGEIIARYDLSEIQEKAYQKGRADAINDLMDIRIELGLVNDESIARLFGKYEQLKEQK